MPRQPRICPPGLPVHVVQRGNNRQVCFADEADLKAYAHWLREAAERHQVAVHAWVFMTNHVHLLMTPEAPGAVSRCMQHLGRCYVRYFNDRYRRTGTLFEGRFLSSLVESRRYLLACQRYIELNPVRAGMVPDPADYSWSSYRCHALGAVAGLWRPHGEYLELGRNPSTRRAAYRQLFVSELESELVDDIRQALETGLALGSDRFKKQIEQLTGRPQRRLKPGRKPKPVALDNQQQLANWKELASR